MDSYENENLNGEGMDTQHQQDPQPAAQYDAQPHSESALEPEAKPESQSQYSGMYSNSGVGRKESPFADSPYVMSHRPQETAYDQPASDTPQSASEKPEKKNKQKRSGSIWRGAAAVVLALILVAGSCGVTVVLVNDHWEGKTAQMTLEMNQKFSALESKLNEYANTIEQVSSDVNNSAGSMVTVMPGGALTPRQVYNKNVQSVVLIHSQVTSYAFGQAVNGISAGSGFILTEDGYVVTNYHVIEGATSVSVTIYDGTEYPATVVGSDATNDMAVLKVEAQGLPAVTIGSSDELNVGDQVVAIGNPLGELTSTMTVGYVSAKDRDVTTDGNTINMIQTDAAINSGNSGGPLFNMQGEVVGITTAKYSGSSSSGATIEGIGFAIPIDDVTDMISDLMEYGYVTGAYLGVSVYSVDENTAKMYNFPMGSLVDSIVSGSCAEKAGIQPKDIIVAVGEYEVTSNTDLTRALRKFDAGDASTITVYRSGQKVVLNITFDEKPQTDPNAATTEPSGQSQMPSDGSYEEWYNYFAPFFGGGNG